jgi:lipoprotein-anchoring transpeptidase ErfK/SrfK
MWRWLLSVAVLLGLLAGCVTRTSPPPPPRAPLDLDVLVDEGAPLGRWIKVEKRERRLIVFDDTEPIRSYPIVLGPEPEGAKLHEGDFRTPEGEFSIIAKYPHPRWSRFLLIDYPRRVNTLMHEWTKEAGLLPTRGSSVPGPGGQVGIHGTSDETRNQRGENWTLGCISLFNRDVEELYSMVDVGTRVVIEKD